MSASIADSVRRAMAVRQTPQVGFCYRADGRFVHAGFTTPAAAAATLRGDEFARLGRFDEAESQYWLALSESPDCQAPRTMLGLMLMARGDFARGLPLFESRPAPQVGDMPMWRGENLTGKTILVLPEAGLGDQVLFSRWLPELRARGAERVIYGAPAELCRLFSHSLPGVSCVPTVAGGHSNVHLPCRPDFLIRPLSLPYLFGARPETIPRAPHLRAAPSDIERWRLRLPAGRLRVGLCWRGGPESGFRSLPSLATLAPVLHVPDVSFVSLQVGAGADEARAGFPGRSITHLGSDVQDFADTAAIVTQLDLVISVDTAIANLAPALGAPTWVLASCVADWRWRHPVVVERLAPTARLFRQHIQGDWREAVAATAQALESLRASRLAA